ncbi:leucine-rich repeat-containing protein 4-like [Strongylocentrotus purpuratus]|uniref:Uncharacterized protein n=1 Tax=Strongylocentrotus purpuratus TaxID=7668 RepID=A0A7M7SZM2_STRPU|nr:leucine-rich repeat-containing protein 4-like [Strongylocentrotus purpuratus]
MIQEDTRKLWIEKSSDQEMNETEGLELLSAVHVNFSRLINVNMLSIRSFPFTVIKPGTFAPLRFLVYMDLMKNKISRLQADTFRGLRRLKEMYIFMNGLQTIEAGAFRGLDSLSMLNMMYNDITRLSSGMFEGLSNLEDM